MKCCPHNTTNGISVRYSSTKQKVSILMPIIGLLSQLKCLIIGRRPYGLSGGSGEE